MGRGRAPCCDKVGLNKGAWTAAEDLRLISHIQKHGHTNWRALPKQAGLLRCGKSCRLRWINYLRPDIKRGSLTGEEEETIIRLHGLLGNKWSKIASYLPGRTDNEIKNVWNTHIKKRLMPKEPKPLANESSEQASSPSPISCSSSGDLQEQNDDGKHTKPLVGNNTSRMASNQNSLDRSIENPLTLNSETKEDIAVLDVKSGPRHVSEGTHPASSSLSFSSTESYVGSSDISFIETTDIPMEPEFWCLIDDDSWLFASAVGSSVEDGGHKNPTNSEEDSTAEVENKTWVAYLEKELDL